MLTGSVTTGRRSGGSGSTGDRRSTLGPGLATAGTTREGYSCTTRCLRLLFVPEANPGRHGRRHARARRRVDPNAFPTSDWRPGTYGPGKWLPDGGGERPLSEPETPRSRDCRLHASCGVLSYHSAGRYLAMGGFSSEESGLLARTPTAAATSARPFVAYPVTGDLRSGATRSVSPYPWKSS